MESVELEAGYTAQMAVVALALALGCNLLLIYIARPVPIVKIWSVVWVHVALSEDCIFSQGIVEITRTGLNIFTGN